jgi:siroheme synthase-like protein
VPVVRYHPVHVDLRGRPCVVVGGGEEAERKVAALLAAGARVTVIDPRPTAGLAALAETRAVEHRARPYRRGDLAGATLAYAVVTDETLAAALAAEAAEAGVWLNVVDRPRHSTFISPAVAIRGPVTVAVSTGGASPALAKRLRDELERAVGPEWGLAAEILGRLRPIVAAAEPEAGRRARVFAALAGAPLLDALRAGDAAAVDALLARVVGAGTTLATLGIALPAAGAAPHGDDGPAAA